jgi:hypothetical protein
MVFKYVCSYAIRLLNSNMLQITVDINFRAKWLKKTPGCGIEKHVLTISVQLGLTPPPPPQI